MKDLFILTADADALAVMKAILSRHQALGIRPITYDVDRHPGKDSGMIQSGPELARMRKGQYHKALLIWDNHGSGWEHKHTPEESQMRIEIRLVGVTWKDNSAAAVLVPELEEWLWHNEESLCGYYGIKPSELGRLVSDFAVKNQKTIAEAKSQIPKELFEHIVKDKVQRTISPRDFEQIALKASLLDWRKSPSFKAIAGQLSDWFPAE